MRWSIIRLIWLRELRDQLRDRRTLFMIAVLPLLLYPLGGIGLAQLAFPFLGQKNAVRIVGYKDLPPARSSRAAAAASWLAVAAPGVGGPKAKRGKPNLAPVPRGRPPPKPPPFQPSRPTPRV